MTAERVVVRKDTYFDSVSLMLASRDVGEDVRVELANVMQATPLNVGMLEVQKFVLPQEVGPNDLVIAVRAQDETALDDAFARMDLALAARVPEPGTGSQRTFRSWRAVKRARPSTSVGIVAVPGRHAAAESAAALEAGLDVFCFSDGVPLEQEVALKTWAAEKDRLFMGPDCGTAIIGGVGLGFANRVDPGPVGIVGASGTGTQEICAQLDRAGIGISHAIGVGSRDLGSAVGGLMTFHSLDRLAEDDATEVIIIVSKPADPAVATRLADRARKLRKPVVIAALGDSEVGGELTDMFTRSMESAVAEACRLLGRPVPRIADGVIPPSKGFVRGFFCGGTLCYQSQLVLLEAGIKVRSNVALDPALALRDPWKSEGHTFVDLGDDEFTDGRLHPMIDPSLRDVRVRREAMEPDVGLILCDVVLGDGAHPDPATDLARYVAEAKAVRNDLNFIISLCGTSKDPQGMERQAQLLREAGALVSHSVESAARSAVASLGAAR